MIAQKHFLLALVTLLLTGASVLMMEQRGVPVVLQTNLENMPLEISGFHGREDSFPQSVYEVLQADQHVYRHYRSPDGKEVSMYIGYYGTAKGGRTGHNPYACLPGAGWLIVERGEIEVSPTYKPQGIRLNYVVAQKDGINNVMLHWYQSAGNLVLASGMQQNVQRFLGRVLQNRNDGAYVQVFSFVNDQDIPQARELAKFFAQEILDLLPAYWPVEG